MKKKLRYVLDIEKEVEICALLKHPFFCELKDVIYGSNALHMVFEHVEGSDICFEIVKRVSSGFIYSEAVARFLFFFFYIYKQLSLN